MATEWEQVDSLPEPRRRGGKKLTLAQGQIMRRPCGPGGMAASYRQQFVKNGRTDYHASVRTVDGVRWLYIWRDPADA